MLANKHGRADVNCKNKKFEGYCQETETNTVRASKGTNRHLEIILGFTVVMVWAAALILHDSWLRPWRVVLTWATVITLTCLGLAVLAQRHSRVHVTILASLVVLVAAIFGIPLPSSLYAARLRNTTTHAVEISFRQTDANRSKSFTLSPFSTNTFLYFRGEGKHPKEFLLKVTVREIGTDKTFTEELRLPIVPGVQSILVESNRVVLKGV